MMKKLLILIFAVSAVLACKSDTTKGTAEASIQSVPSTGADEIITEAAPIDTSNVAKLSFDEERFNFGKVDEGEVVKHTFTFTNTGTEPLVITNARSTCGCTVPIWPKEPVGVGESEAIEVSFNTTGKKNNQMKPVTITANTYPAQTVVYLSGFVTPEPKPATSVAN